MAPDVWLTAAELAALGLADWPSSAFNVRARLAKLGTPSRIREGSRGGGGREYDLASLPATVRRAWLQRQVASAPALPAPEVPAAAPEQLPAPVAQQLPAAPAPRRQPSKMESACADARTLIVRRLQALAAVDGMTRATEVLSAQLASAKAPADLLQLAEAANQRPRTAEGGVAISARTLFRWVGEHRKGGWQALLPKPVQAKPLATVGEDVAMVLKRYASTSGAARNLTQVARDLNAALGRRFDEWEPLYERARRALPKLDTTRLIKARHKGAERAAKLPFKRRLVEGLETNDVWVMDGHTFKAKVRHPEHGQPFAPEVTLALDVSDSYVVGWSVSLSENVLGVAACLRHAITAHGVPAIVYTDNGGGETAKPLDCPAVGMYARLGIDHRLGRPAHPQGHGKVERSWQTHMIRAARKFATYQGKDADGTNVRDMRGAIDKERRALERARKSGDVVTLNGRVPSWQQFMNAVAEAVATYNAEHEHRRHPKHESGPRIGRHMTPAELRQLKLQPEATHRLDSFELQQLALPSTVRVAQRGEVAFLNRFYFNEDLMQVDGERVRVDYDLVDASRVWIWTLQGQFVCEALETRQAGSNGMPYFPANALEQARHQRVQAAVKRAEAKIELARRELQPTLPAPMAEFQVPGFPIPPRREPVFVERVEETPAPAAVDPDARPSAFDTASERYEWLMHHRAAWQGDDAAWLARYAEGNDYQALASYFEARGIAWPPDPSEVFKTAG